MGPRDPAQVVSLVWAPLPAEPISLALYHRLHIFFSPTKYHYVDQVGLELAAILLPLLGLHHHARLIQSMIESSCVALAIHCFTDITSSPPSSLSFPASCQVEEFYSLLAKSLSGGNHPLHLKSTAPRTSDKQRHKDSLCSCIFFL